MNLEHVRKIVAFIKCNHNETFAKTLRIIEAELTKCRLCGMTKQMETYGNILINTLLDGRKIVVDESRAWLVNFTIAGEGL
jgi:hypothetical protein